MRGRIALSQPSTQINSSRSSSVSVSQDPAVASFSFSAGPAKRQGASFELHIGWIHAQGGGQHSTKSGRAQPRTRSRPEARVAATSTRENTGKSTVVQQKRGGSSFTQSFTVRVRVKQFGWSTHTRANPSYVRLPNFDFDFGSLFIPTHSPPHGFRRCQKNRVSKKLRRRCARRFR